MKYIDAYSLGQMPELEIKQLVRDLKRTGLEHLMEFHKPWNNEIICQFYASYHLDIPNHYIHSTTKGKRYKVDAITFSCLLGFGKEDHNQARISDLSQLAIMEY